MKNKKHPNFQDLYSIDDIKKAMRCSKRTGYYPISLIRNDQEDVLGNTHRLGKYDLNETSQRTYTLKYWYAMQVWNTAVAVASSCSVGNELLYILPHWEDRDESFRMLVNDKDFTPGMVDLLWKRLEEIADSGNIKVHEGFFIENVTKGYWGDPGKCHIDSRCKFVLHVIVDQENVRKTKFPINDLWEHPFCKDDKTFRWEEIKHLFCEVSLPVRELMNAKWMYREYEHSEELFKACDRLDIDGVKAALNKGVKINAMDRYGNTALTRAVEYYYEAGVSYDKGYTDEELDHIKEQNYNKLIPIIDYLLDNGADINLYGHDGMTPVVEAYYSHSPELVEYLLMRGANPNVNCYLMEHFEAEYCSTILSCIYDEIDELDESDKKIESIVKRYGGRLYHFGFNPAKYEYTGRTFLGIYPREEDIFLDAAFECCGDYKTLHTEIAENEFVDIDISSIEGWEQWHREVIEDYYEKKYQKTNDEWDEWFDRGLELAKQLKALLPDNVDLYYLYNNKPVFNTYSDGIKRWNRDGERILIV